MKVCLREVIASISLCLAWAPNVVAQDMVAPPYNQEPQNSAQIPSAQIPSSQVPEQQGYVPSQSNETAPPSEPSQFAPQYAPPYASQPQSGPYYGNAQYGTPYHPYYPSTQYGNGSYSRSYSPYIPPYNPNGYSNYKPQSPYSLRPQYAYAPAGLVIPVTLATSISTQVASSGDYVQANISQNVPLQGLSYIPAGSSLSGQVTDAVAGRFFDRSGLLSMTFQQLRLPDGRSIAIQAHVLGNIAKYAQNSNGQVRGEGWGTKLGSFALRSAIGAGSGALFGTAVGAITGNVGRGAWSGTAIGGGLGVLDDLVLRKGRNVLIHAGTPMQIQLDAPLEIPMNTQTGNS